jgi:hypothetical protein
MKAYCVGCELSQTTLGLNFFTTSVLALKSEAMPLKLPPMPVTTGYVRNRPYLESTPGLPQEQFTGMYREAPALTKSGPVAIQLGWVRFW